MSYCLFSAISPVAYHFIPQLAAGGVFGPDVEISIRLLDNPSNQEQLQGKHCPPAQLPIKLEMLMTSFLVGVAMETQDLAFPLLRNIRVCMNALEAFKGVSAVVFLEDDDSPEADESRDEFLRNKAERFIQYARLLDDVASPEVKVSFHIEIPCRILFVNSISEESCNISKAAGRLN